MKTVNSLFLIVMVMLVNVTARAETVDYQICTGNWVLSCQSDVDPSQVYQGSNDGFIFETCTDGSCEYTSLQWANHQFSHIDGFGRYITTKQHSNGTSVTTWDINEATCSGSTSTFWPNNGAWTNYTCDVYRTGQCQSGFCKAACQSSSTCEERE